MPWYIKTLRRRFRSLTRRWAVPLGCGLIFMLIFNYIFFIGYVPTASMEPAIREGSLIFGIRAFPGLKRGDVVVFRHDGMLLVKRIEGAPGDIVDAADGRSAVPGGRYYMLGDNEENSVDSRCWDEPFVPSEEIIALIRAG